MDKKSLIGLALFCSVCATGCANNLADESAYPENEKIFSDVTAVVEVREVPDDAAQISVPESARTAADRYETAMSSANASDRDKYLAEAISSIAEAAVAQPENPDILILASQIYRAKGGLSYARSYYKRACNLYKTAADSRPHDASAQLAMAIACYAGDARYERAYELSKALGENYAQYVLAEKSAPAKTLEQGTPKDEMIPQTLPEKILEQEAQNEKSADVKIPEQGAQKDADDSSAKPEDKKTETTQTKNSAGTVEKFLAALVLQDKELQEKFYAAMDRSAFTAREEKIMELYEKVEAGSWLWNVSSQQAAEQELLLKYLRLW